MRGDVKAQKTAVFLAVFFSGLLVFGSAAAGQELAALDLEISRLVDRISGSVVTVEARQEESRIPVFPGYVRTLTKPVNTVVGSGLVIDSAGHILTILSLVDGNDNFQVEVGGRTVDAALVGVDRRHELALLKINQPTRNYLTPSTLPPFTGRLAVAYGRTLGRTGYPSLGIIAGRQADGSFLMSGSVLPGLLGGGIFDLSGNLIGIIISGSVGGTEMAGNIWGGIVMLPASIALAAADRIICCGSREAGYLGIRTTAIELVSSNEQVLGEAVAISEVEPNSPAAMAGLRIGDIITRFARLQVSSDRELQRLISSAGSDSTVLIEFIRGQRRHSVAIPLAPFSGPRTESVVMQFFMLTGARGFLAAGLQRRIDSMQAEMEQLQRELDRLIGRAGSTR